MNGFHDSWPLSRFQLQSWFLFGRHCGQMSGQVVNETVGPYACLTHTLRKSLTIRWTKTGKIEGTTQTRDAYDWDNRMANLPLPLLHLWAWASVYLQRKEWKAITDWKYSFQLIQVEGPTSKPDTLRKRNLWEKLTHPYATQGFAYAHGSYDPPKTNQYMRGFGPCSPGKWKIIFKSTLAKGYVGSQEGKSWTSPTTSPNKANGAFVRRNATHQESDSKNSSDRQNRTSSGTLANIRGLQRNFYNQPQFVQ